MLVINGQHGATLAAVTTHMYWYMGRSSGFVAYWLLFASVALGLAVSSRVFDGVLARPWVFEMHRFLSVLVVAVMIFHGLIMLPDAYAKYTLPDLLVPMHTKYRPVATAIGICTLYGSILITLSFYLKGLIGQKTWRALHYLTFALFVGATAHGVWTGTDTKSSFVWFSYLSAAMAVLFLTFFRILAARSVRPRPAPAKRQAVVPDAV